MLLKQSFFRGAEACSPIGKISSCKIALFVIRAGGVDDYFV